MPPRSSPSLTDHNDFQAFLYADARSVTLTFWLMLATLVAPGETFGQIPFFPPEESNPRPEFASLVRSPLDRHSMSVLDLRSYILTQSNTKRFSPSAIPE